MAKILNVHNLEKTYSSGSKKLTVLHDISFEIEERETFAIVGLPGAEKPLCWGFAPAWIGLIPVPYPYAALN